VIILNTGWRYWGFLETRGRTKSAVDAVKRCVISQVRHTDRHTNTKFFLSLYGRLHSRSVGQSKPWVSGGRNINAKSFVSTIYWHTKWQSIHRRIFGYDTKNTKYFTNCAEFQ